MDRDSVIINSWCNKLQLLFPRHTNSLFILRLIAPYHRKVSVGVIALCKRAMPTRRNHKKRRVPNWIPQNLTDDMSNYARCRNAIDHYLSKWWPGSISPYCISMPHCVKPVSHQIWSHDLFLNAVFLMKNLGPDPITMHKHEINTIYFLWSQDVGTSLLCVLAAWNVEPV